MQLVSDSANTHPCSCTHTNTKPMGQILSDQRIITIHISTFRCENFQNLKNSKTKNDCSLTSDNKDIINTMKRQTEDWKNILAVHITDKGLLSRITKDYYYKGLIS